jgi:putative hydrolase
MNFKRFTEIDADYRLSDLHMHSTWTDGEGSIEEIINHAKKIGLKRIAITDHIRESSTYFDDYSKEIRRLREAHQFEVYVGFEAKVNNFSGDIDVSKLNLRDTEISICSVHRFPIGRKLIPASAFNENTAQEIELELAMAALGKGGFNVLGHPGGMSIRSHGKFKTEYFEEIISGCAGRGIAFDFNASYHGDFSSVLLDLFAKYDPLISLGSDAHRLNFIGSAEKLF